jgi:hypothetical protein
LAQVQGAQEEVERHVEPLRQVAQTLDPQGGNRVDREARFRELAETFARDDDPVRQSFAKTMTSFEPGLFVGGDNPDLPIDNLDLERWFRQPKSHERRIHGRCHAGVRIVQEGSTLLPTLDAHNHHPEPFTQGDLSPYANANPPVHQREALHRRSIMRKARSKKQRPALLQSLEQRFHDSS